MKQIVISTVPYSFAEAQTYCLAGDYSMISKGRAGLGSYELTNSELAKPI